MGKEENFGFWNPLLGGVGVGRILDSSLFVLLRTGSTPYVLLFSFFVLPPGRGLIAAGS